MVENTKIEWASHTLNWWTGCQEVGPGCQNCYAESWAKRAGRDFAERRLTTIQNRLQPFKWNGHHLKFYREHGHRQRVFVNSLADVFDNHAPQTWRNMLWRMIRFTPFLDYILLTKRIGNAKRMLPTDFSAEAYPNVWLGISACIQEDIDRDLIKLLKINAACHFISAEPMAGPLSFPDHQRLSQQGFVSQYLMWVINGGESGAHARPMSPGWAVHLRNLCVARGVKYFFKQGSQTDQWGGRKGFKDFATFPPDLQMRDHPRTNEAIWYQDRVEKGEYDDHEPRQLTLEQRHAIDTFTP